MLTRFLSKHIVTTKDVQLEPDIIDVTFKGLITTLSIPSQWIVRQDGAFYAQGHFQQSYPCHGGGEMPANDIQPGKRVHQSICFAVRSCLTTYQTLSGHHYRMFAGLLTIGPCVRQIQSEPRGSAVVEALPDREKDKTIIIERHCPPRLCVRVQNNIIAAHSSYGMTFKSFPKASADCMSLYFITAANHRQMPSSCNRTPLAAQPFCANFADVQLPISKW